METLREISEEIMSLRFFERKDISKRLRDIAQKLIKLANEMDMPEVRNR